MAEDVIFGDDQEEPAPETQEQSSSQAGPDLQLQSGSVHLDVWKNQDSPDTYSFKRFYTQDDGQTYEETQNMRPRDLEHVKTLITKAQLEEVDQK